MSNPQQNDLDIQCIFTSNIPTHCFPYISSSELGSSSVTYYTLLVSLGVLRWTVKRELNQIYILDQSLKVPKHISSLLPAKSPRKRDSARAIAQCGRKLSKYLKQLAHHKSAAEANFVVFATSRMQIFQYYVVKGCSQQDLNGIYVYKEHQGSFAKYEKHDNPNFLLINKFVMNHAGWYLVDKWRACFYAKGLAKESEFPPAGTWRGVTKGQSSEYIEVVCNLPKKVEIESALRRKMYFLHKRNISRVQCRLLSAGGSAMSPLSPWRSPSSPSVVEAEYVENVRRYISSPIKTAYTKNVDSEALSTRNFTQMPVTRMFQNAPLTPEPDDEICSILNLERDRNSELCLEDREPARFTQGRKVNTPIWLTSSMPAIDGRRHRPSHTVDPEAIPTERDRKHTGKAPFKFSPLKIKIPSRPDLPPALTASDSEDSMDSDRESSLEMLTSRRSRSSESGSMEMLMLTPRKVSRVVSSNSNQLRTVEARKQNDESDTASVRWFSYAVNETDDSLLSPSSKTETYSTRELHHNNSESYKSPYERRSGEIENECGEATVTADSHIWNPSGRRDSGSTARSSTRSLRSNSISKTPIVREKTSPTTSDPDHVFSLQEARSSREEKEELSRSYSRSSTGTFAHTLNSPSVIHIARLSTVVRSPASIITPTSVEDTFEEQSTGSSSMSYYQQKINSKSVTTEVAPLGRRKNRGSRAPRRTLL